MSFNNKVAIVTGSSNGIGKEIAIEFANNGAIVIVNGRDNIAVENTVNEINNNGGKAFGYVADVTKKDKVIELINSVVKNFGKVDILVNNAGGSFGAITIEELTEDEWDGVIELNLKSVFLCSQAVIGIMKKQGYGRIVNISSQAGRAVSILAGPHYASAKAGVISFTKHIAKEVSSYGITVNTVAPGIIYSGSRLATRWDLLDEEGKGEILKDIPVGRLGKNKEVSAAVLFLASEEASYIQGACLDVNGGRWML